MSKFKLGVLIGCGIGLAGVAAAAIWMLRDPIPPLTQGNYDAALARWNDRGPQDYDMTVVFSGRQPGNYEVEVRGGEVTQLVRDGEPLPNRGASWHFWTVRGMFDIMAMDLAAKDIAAKDLSAKAPAAIDEQRQAEVAVEVKVSAEFDDAWGYPRRYRQITLGDSRSTSDWQITAFTPRSDDAN